MVRKLSGKAEKKLSRGLTTDVILAYAQAHHFQDQHFSGDARVHNGDVIILVGFSPESIVTG
jgi:hypothetical protein